MNQPIISTTPNAGLPLNATRKKPAADMTPDDWTGLINGLVEFFAEEAAEPEHAQDDAADTKPLYVNRPLKNADALIAWARSQGFKKTLPPDEMHCTIAYSKAPVDWGHVGELKDIQGVPDAESDMHGQRSVEQLGDKGAIVLRFESPDLQDRWRQFKAAGASWDYDEYSPHVTFTFDAGDVDLAKVEPYTGEMVFGPERFVELKLGDDWSGRAKASMVGDAVPAAAGIQYTDPAGNVLLLKRSGHGDHENEWAFPAGGIEAGETPEQAARRESVEETGHEPAGELKLLDRSASGQGAFHTFGNHVAEQFTPKLNDEHTEHIWAHPDKPPAPLHPGVANLFAAAGKGPLGKDATEAEWWEHGERERDREQSARGIEEIVEALNLIADPVARDADFKEGDHPRAPDGNFGSGGGGAAKPAKAEAKVAASSEYAHSGHRFPDVVYRRSTPENEEQSSMAEGRGVYVSTDPATATQWGKVNKYRVTKQPLLMDLGDYKNGRAREFVARELGKHPKTLTEEEFDETAAEIFIQNDGIKRLNQMGFGGYRLGHDAFLMGKLSDHTKKEGPLAGDVSPEFEHEAVIRYNGDFNMGEFLRMICEVGDVGHSFDIVIDPGDRENEAKFGWDGDGADRIVSAEIDGADALKGGGAADESLGGVEVDATHDGPWMSCMSVDGKRMYRNKNVPEEAEIDGKTVRTDPILLAHEVPERKDLETILKVFKEQGGGREPTPAEREVIYNGAHIRSGIPGERAHLEANGINEAKWNAWCRGIEAKIERGPFENEPDDADVKPIQHTHNELGATDSALVLAMDRESIRKLDRDGRMHVDDVNICKVCVSPYMGREIPGWDDDTQTHSLGLDPDKTYQLLRPADQIEKAGETSNGIQLLKVHVPVDVNDHRPYDIAGTTGSDARFEYPYLKNSLHLWTKEAIKDLESKAKADLSPGYSYEPVMEPGVFEGQPYDGWMKIGSFNHIAMVENGRQPGILIGDSAHEIHWASLDRALAESLRP